MLQDFIFRGASSWRRCKLLHFTTNDLRTCKVGPHEHTIYSVPSTVQYHSPTLLVPVLAYRLVDRESGECYCYLSQCGFRRESCSAICRPKIKLRLSLVPSDFGLRLTNALFWTFFCNTFLTLHSLPHFVILLLQHRNPQGSTRSTFRLL